MVVAYLIPCSAHSHLAPAPPAMEMSLPASAQNIPGPGTNNRSAVSLCMQKVALTPGEAVPVRRFSLTISGL